MTMITSLTRTLTALLLAAILLAALPAGAHANTQALLSRALALTALPHEAFHAAPRTPPFDWSSDGCSRTPASWARVFALACRQHDFGYRNLGNGLRLQRTEPTRRFLDERLLAESRRICSQRAPGAGRAVCDVRAQAMYVAVRVFGPRWG
jgi:hypothetical protein